MSKRGAFEQRAPGRPAAKPGTGEHSHTIYGRENQVSSVALPALFGLRVRAVCINIVLALGSTRSCTSIIIQSYTPVTSTLEPVRTRHTRCSVSVCSSVLGKIYM